MLRVEPADRPGPRADILGFERQHGEHASAEGAVAHCGSRRDQQLQVQGASGASDIAHRAQESLGSRISMPPAAVAVATRIPERQSTSRVSARPRSRAEAGASGMN